MSASTSFQRARDPEQKEQRRQDLLAAARQLIAAGGLPAVGLSAIAREAGLAKSNVYRYFGSREEILLELLAEDADAWATAFEAAAAALTASDDVARVAAIVAATVAAQPMTCELIAVVAGVLEHNTSATAAAAFKARMLALSIRIHDVLVATLPSLPPARATDVVRYLHALIGGLWPMARPNATMCAILAEPRYASLRCDFEADLRGCLRALLSGLCHGGRATVAP
ncbi:MAG: TetR family transcriptional regulator [Kofleriaceae bacterium]